MEIINRPKEVTRNKLLVIKSKEDELMDTLVNFFKLESNLDVMIPILKGETKISLRLIDYFVTNYSKFNNTKYEIRRVRNGKMISNLFFVHTYYKAQLKSYSKKLFDPFCRRSRIWLEYDNNKSIHTTIGQLNFFRWAIENHIIEYIEKNYDNITAQMNEKSNVNVSASKLISGHKCIITLTFD
jgi:hypothetical protein|uniref:Uncharacterized protein n=1 Tax=viral metagenome TaxID=1070528 RepID=A0A6C0J584_9ZZZZ